MQLGLWEIIHEVKGKVSGIEDNQRVSTISTDTRNLSEGSLFVALKGENFDGHDYVQQALDQGACAVVVEELRDYPFDKIILVEDTRLAYLEIAGMWRRKLEVQVVGITGSVGKTTTKEMTALVLNTKGKTLKTRANLNNEIGLATMLLELDESYSYAVLELGVDGPDQMLPMAKAAAPQVAIVTNIGDSHKEAFGNKENIQKEKIAISEGLGEDGFFLLNGDDPYLMGKTARKQSAYFGIDSLGAEIQGKHITVGNDFTDFIIYFVNKQYPVHLPVAGIHNVYDALAAFGAGVALGVSPEDAITALEDYHSEGMRQKLVSFGDMTIIEDCYNASPQSMEAALDTLSKMKTEGRKIALLGDMLELGQDEKQAHYELGVLAQQKGIDALFVVGELGKEIVKGATDAGLKHVYYFIEKQQAGKELKIFLKSKDILWVKASRGMRLEEILEIIYQEE